MEIDQLLTFLSVLEHGSFSRAGQALGVGQSTVSFHIKALERAAGSRLLDRGGGRVRPTATGRTLLRYARRIVSLREEALSRLGAERSATAGHLTIAASTIPAEYLLPPALARFRKAHPLVGITIDVSDSRRAIAELIDQNCDLALVGATMSDRRVAYSPVAEDEVVLVGPLPNPFAPSGRLGHTAFARVPLIVREEGSGTRKVVARLIARRAAHDAKAVTIQVGSTEAAKRCAAQGVGLALVSRRAVAEELAARRLGLVSAPGLPARRRFWAARLEHVTLSRAAKELLALLSE